LAPKQLSPTEEKLHPPKIVTPQKIVTQKNIFARKKIGVTEKNVCAPILFCRAKTVLKFIACYKKRRIF
jgi:hypothetical protein